jgi:predicted dehydrogenase
MREQMTRVRWGLIGCGDIAKKRVAPAFRDSARSELVAVSRAKADLAESFAKQFGAKRWFPDWRDMLRDKEVDAIYIATPVQLHAPQAVAAAEAGKHVLCEKPMALNVAECDEIIAASKANNVKLGIAYYRHFYPVVGRIKEVLESDEIGSPIVVQINAFEWFNPGPKHSRSWLIKKEVAGGGPMFDFGCHRIEVLLNIFGGISEIKASIANVLFDREVGLCGTLTVSHATREPQDTIDVFGSRGSIHVPVLNDGQMRVLSEDGERTELHPPAANFHLPLIEDFTCAILEDREPAVGGETGKQVAIIEEQIYETTR